MRIRVPLVLTAVPDRRRRPSDGLVVEASILARLLGIRLLKLDATVVIVPADVTAPSSAARVSPLPAVAPSPRALPDRQPAGVGGGLAEAIRRIDEGAAILAAVRANRSVRRRGHDGRVS